MDNLTVVNESVQRYVDILTNSGFKALFSDRNNKDAVMSIINTFLPEHRRVVDIEYMPTEHQGQTVGSKEYRYDFMCRDADGVVFIVEMQNYSDSYWFRRCVSYASRAYDRQNRRGERYDVPPVYLIGLMGTEIRHEDMSQWENEFVSEYSFREKRTNELLDETICIIFVEMAKFSKAVHECQSDVDRMIYLLKNMGRLHNQPADLQREIYSRIFEACEIAMFDESKRIEYDKDMYDERRYRSELWTARMEGIEEGRQEGRMEGRMEGVSEGKREIASKMISMGMSDDDILTVTGLTPEVLEGLKAM